jgi:hypothetical protein
VIFYLPCISFTIHQGFLLVFILGGGVQSSPFDQEAQMSRTKAYLIFILVFVSLQNIIVSFSTTVSIWYIAHRFYSASLGPLSIWQCVCSLEPNLYIACIGLSLLLYIRFHLVIYTFPREPRHDDRGGLSCKQIIVKRSRPSSLWIFNTSVHALCSTPSW